MRITFRKLAITLSLAFGVAIMALIFLQLHAHTPQRDNAALRVACTTGKGGGDCANNKSVIQLGAIVVTPTQAEQRYLASHSMARMRPTANLGGSTATPLADVAVPGVAGNAIPIPAEGRHTDLLSARQLAHAPAAA